MEFTLSRKRTLLLSLCSAFFVVLSIGSVPVFGSGRIQEQETFKSVADSVERTWTSANGKYSIEGRLNGLTIDKIRIETDGKTVVVELAKLSEADREFVQAERERSTANDNPFMDVEESPFESTDKATSTVEEKRLVGDWSQVESIQLRSEKSIDASNWDVASIDFRPFEINLDSIHERMTHGAISLNGEFFLASFRSPFGTDRFGSAHPEVEEWLAVYALKDGKRVGQFPLADDKLQITDYDPESRQVLGFTGTFSREKRVSVFGLAEQSLVPVLSWSTERQGSARFNVNNARFLKGGRIITSADNDLVVWDRDSATAIYSIADPQSWRLSPDGTQLLVKRDDVAYQVDVASGEVMGVVGGDAVLSNGNTSPDGTRLATLSGRTMTISTESGDTVDEFQVPVSWPDAELKWIDDEVVVIKLPYSDHYVDVPRRVAFLQWNHHARSQAEATALFVADDEMRNHRRRITIRPMKSESAKDTSQPDLDAARSKLPDPEALLVLEAGDRVAIEVAFQTERNHAGEAERMVRDLLESRGVIIDPQADDTIRIQTSANTEKVEYRSFGASPWSNEGTETVTVRRVTRSVLLVRDGKVIWAMHGGSGGASPVLHLQEGESAQQAVNRNQSDPDAFWGSLELPRHVAQHPNGRVWQVQFPNR